MVECPKCGSTAQPKVIEVTYIEDGWTIERKLTYKCGCGEEFVGHSYFYSDSTEWIGGKE